MKTIVVGCGRIGADLAYRLYKREHAVTVIDEVEAAFQNLPADFRGRTLAGDVLSEEMHHRCGMAQAQSLAAVTNVDSLNAVVGHIARTVYQIPNVVIRNYNPRRRALCDAFDLPVISSSTWGAQQMEELLTPTSTRPMLTTGGGEVGIYTITISEKLAGHLVQELLADSAALPVALTRAAGALLPTAETRLAAGDRLLVSATPDGMSTLQQRL